MPKASWLITAIGVLWVILVALTLYGGHVHHVPTYRVALALLLDINVLLATRVVLKRRGAISVELQLMTIFSGLLSGLGILNMFV